MSEVISQEEVKLTGSKLRKFIDNCDKDSHTYVAIYSKQNLMRALDAPYRYDLPAQGTKLLERCLPNFKIDDTNDPLPLDRNNPQQIKEIIRQELEKQARSYTGSADCNVGINIEEIRKELQIFLIEYAKEEEIINTARRSAAIIYSPHHYYR